MVTVALIGADGAGKTTIARAVEHSGELPVKYLYMGINSAASNHMLPTTRLLRALRRALGVQREQGGPPDPARRDAGRRKGVLHATKSALGLLNRLGEEWYRAFLAWCYELRGYTVLFDRHFYADYHAHDIRSDAELSLARRIHGKLLRRLPRPDCVIVLDAPAAVLWARKPEGTPELLERRRQEYLELRSEVENCAVVDASQPREEVVRAVLGIIRGLQRPESAPRDAGGGR